MLGHHRHASETQKENEKKNVVNVGPPLTKLSRSTHAFQQEYNIQWKKTYIAQNDINTQTSLYIRNDVCLGFLPSQYCHIVRVYVSV